jgi:hypothetical protein
MPATCPISCRRAGNGVFLVTAATYTALWSKVFLGGDFDGLVSAFIRAPQSPSLGLIGWTLTMMAGLCMIGIGLRAVPIDSNDVPVRSWLIAAAAAGAVLLWGSYLPGAWMLAVRGTCFAVIAAAVTNACLALHGAVWWSGFDAGEAYADHAGGSLPDYELADTIERLTAERDQLADELAQTSAPANDLAIFVEVIGGRRKLLAWLHPDRVKGEAEKQAATVKFQKASALLDRIEGKNR